MNYLLDTNACIGMIRATARKSIAKAISLSSSQIFISSVVRFELLSGAERSARPLIERQKVENFCAQFNSLSFDDDCAEEAAKVRTELESLGTKIGPYDTLIAATARLHNLTVVTGNTGEFSRVKNLRVEDWES
jgi:tRNA(fMet)-specific endonuclease VapC